MTVWCLLACDYCGEVFQTSPQISFIRGARALLRSKAAKKGWTTRRHGRILDDYCCEKHARKAEEEARLEIEKSP